MCVFDGHTRTKISAIDVVLPLDPDAEDLEGITIGWRQWNFHNDGFLKSPHQGTKWEPGKPVVANKKDLPRYGVFAYHEQKAAEDNSSGNITGQVALWGDVYEWAKKKKGPYGEEPGGFTAQYAYPITLFVPPSWERTHPASHYDYATGMYKKGTSIDVLEALFKAYAPSGVWINRREKTGAGTKKRAEWVPYEGKTPIAA